MNNETVNSVQSLNLKDRKKLTISGVKSLDSYDDTHIVVTTSDGVFLTVEGSEISVKDVNIDKSILEADGNFTTLFYEENRVAEKNGLFGRLLGKK